MCLGILVRAVAVALLGVVAAGCVSSGEKAPTLDERTQRPQQVQTSETPQPPSPTPDGPSVAEQFVIGYFNEFNNALESGDFTRVRGMFRDSCTLCKKDIDNAEALASEGKIFRGIRYEVLETRQTSSGIPSITSVVAHVRTSAGAIVDSRGAVLESYHQTKAVKLVVDVVWNVQNAIIADVIQGGEVG